jgi:hypothetical protein
MPAGVKRIYARSKEMKKVFALVACLTMCGAALFAQTAANEADFETEAKSGGAVITGYKGQGGDVVIPATIGGKAVVGIGYMAFGTGPTSVTIPEGLTGIDDYAFYECESLISITLPASVTSVGYGAFYGCDKLKPEISADIEKRFGERVFFEGR